MVRERLPDCSGVEADCMAWDIWCTSSLPRGLHWNAVNSPARPAGRGGGSGRRDKASGPSAARDQSSAANVATTV
jgi:hypothetical protein